MSLDETYTTVQRWLKERCPKALRSGDGMQIDVALEIQDFITTHCDDVWTFENLDKALHMYLAADSLTAEDCVFLWKMGIRADEDIHLPEGVVLLRD